ncbi:MAG: peptidoglycan DD-metalloendopeptidase family protein [Myxococcaceae bacterium]
MKRNRLFLPLGLVLFVFSLTSGFYFIWQEQGLGVNNQVGNEEVFETPLLSRTTDRIRSGETLSQALIRHDLSQQDATDLIALLGKELNLKLIRAGDIFIIEKNVGYAQAQTPFSLFELVRQESRGIPVRYRIVRPENGGLAVARIDTPVTERRTVLSGRIHSSLYEGILSAGGDAGLVNRFSELFGWQLDFYREAQKGDTFKVIVESRYAEGRLVGFGRVLAAEYNNSGKIYRGFRFESEDSKFQGFFDERGQSIEKGFLKAPMALTRITSRYGQRFHPVLQRQKKHNGVDYGAPTGTPFWAIADGVVLEARYSPTAGRMIRIRHRGGYVTEYFHSSRIAPGVRPGASVKQKQIIGYVGTTGRSTGPHLHFGMMLNKNYVDPSRQRFPAGQPLPSKLVNSYFTKIKPLIEELKKIEVS